MPEARVGHPSDDALIPKVRAALVAAGVEARIETLPVEWRDHDDVARLVGCTLVQVVVPQLAMADGKEVALLLPGGSTLDSGHAARALGARHVVPSAAGAAVKSGDSAAQPVAPLFGRLLGHATSVVVEKVLLHSPELWVVISPRTVIVLSPGELVRVLDASVGTLMAGGRA